MSLMAHLLTEGKFCHTFVSSFNDEIRSDSRFVLLEFYRPNLIMFQSFFFRTKINFMNRHKGQQIQCDIQIGSFSDYDWFFPSEIRNGCVKCNFFPQICERICQICNRSIEDTSFFELNKKSQSVDTN